VKADGFFFFHPVAMVAFPYRPFFTLLILFFASDCARDAEPALPSKEDPHRLFHRDDARAFLLSTRRPAYASTSAASSNPSLWGRNHHEVPPLLFFKHRTIPCFAFPIGVFR